jgi:arylsulfatase A-like enzyme
MRIILLMLMLTLSLASSSFVEEARAADQNRYNVLFIAIDDLRPELGCYGVDYGQSRHLDEFARSAVVFDRHYVQVATCGASRYALLTGRSPATSGVTRSNAALYSGKSALSQQPLPGAQSMPELFRRSGYRTVCVGKISHTADGRVFAYNGKGDGRDEVPHAWDALPTPFGPWKRGWGIFFAYSGGRSREDGGGHKDLMDFKAEKDEDLPDGLLAQEAISQLRTFKEKDQRFFLGLGLFKPHLPFVAPKHDWDAIAEEDVDGSLSPKIVSPYWHSSGEFYKYNTPYKKTRPLSVEARRTARRAYLACVRYADRQVGKVLSELDKLGLAENTIVVVWGDHGWHLGEQQIWAKHSPFERANRSVLMVRAPGVSKPGVKTSALAETVDLYPTLTEICQPSFQQTRFELDGVSLKPVLTGQKASVRDAAISYWGDAISIRSKSHRLIVKVRDKQILRTELYDLSSNPDSVTNIAATEPLVMKEILRHLPAEIQARK